MAVDLMVIPRSISSCLARGQPFSTTQLLRPTHLVSVNRISPALAPAMIPALETSESVRVDFPWSTWAITDMFRMLVGLS